MKRVVRAITLLGVMLLIGCASTSDIASPEDFEMLTGEQVRELISGNTLRGNFRANPLIIAFHQDGLARERLGFRGAGRGQGTIDGDIYCHQWTTYFGGKRRCYHWYRRPDNNLDNVDAFRFRGPLLGRIEPGIARGF